MKEFKTESKKVLDMMINSVYKNKDIFLRELISNGSDALDKIYYESLTNKKLKLKKEDLEINISLDKEKRTLTISDNGCGMSKEELENNLGVIAASGTSKFREKLNKKDSEIIGQFGVGFYSSFMVSQKVEVISKKEGEDSYRWLSEGIEGYEIKKASKEERGTDVILYLKDDNDDFDYSRYLEMSTLESLIKKHSDYIMYPIKGEVEEEKDGKKITEIKTFNSMIPLWKRNEKDIKKEEYNDFYKDKFSDFIDPLYIIHSKVEGKVEFRYMLYIPSHIPYDLYSKDYEKGLSLYSNGVLIMDKCKDLLPDYLNFVKGVVDSPDLSLNISREVVQENKILSLIKRTIEKKVIAFLEEKMKEDREIYEKFFKEFGLTLKYNCYNNFGLDKDSIIPLLLFKTSKEDKYESLEEIVKSMKKEDDTIYYGVADTVDKIKQMPNYRTLTKQGKNVLYLTDYVDEFAIKIINEYEGKKFSNIQSADANILSEEDQKRLSDINEKNKDLRSEMKKLLKDEVIDVKLTESDKDLPVSLANVGEVSLEMEKTLQNIPNADSNMIKAEKVLEININHPIYKKLKKLEKDDKKALKSYTNILYNSARLIEGMPIDSPLDLTNSIIDLLSK